MTDKALEMLISSVFSRLFCGIAKGYPDNQDIRQAVDFIKGLSKK